MSDWTQHAQRALARAGYRSSAPRAAVVEAVGELGCGATAAEIHDRATTHGRRVGLASVYRALELLDRLRLVQRIEVGDGGTRYEPFLSNGHHHHLVCERCGQVAAFEDPELERTIARVAGRVEFAVDAHDVTLRGECPSCHGGAAAGG